MRTARARAFLFLFILLVSAGCAAKPNFVLDDGTPAPTTVYMERNFQTGMTAEAYIARVILKKEKDENGNESTRPEPAEYLRLGTGEVQKLEPDTFAIGGRVRILNPEKVPYTLFVVYVIDYPEERWPYTVSRVLYMGDSEDETFGIKRQIEDANPEVKCRVVIQEGELEELVKEKTVFEFNTSFVLKEEDKDQNRP